ncbi:MAG TPA: sugar ABC transporter substrate-binding protein, partial [Brevibacterium sp.]|nr:sugar ABC transporter substrate-binding protein [Brevibacterium sp.]
AGKRTSTYENPDYQKAAGPFFKQTEDAINSADPVSPGVQPRPTLGVQFVTIPEFADLATGISEDVSSAIAGRSSADSALEKGQKAAQKVGDKYKK